MVLESKKVPDMEFIENGNQPKVKFPPNDQGFDLTGGLTEPSEADLFQSFLKFSDVTITA